MLTLKQSFIIFGTVLCVTALFCTYSNSNELLAAQVYKWVDANGVEHFSDKPFKKAKKLKVKVAKSDAPDVKAEKAAAPELFDVGDTKRVAKECSTARKNLAALLSGRVVLEKDAEGNELALDEKRKAAQVQKNQTYLDSYCNSVSTGTRPVTSESEAN